MAAKLELAAVSNLGHSGAELYPFKLCEKCPFYSCWCTTLITLHYLLTFQGVRGALLPVCLAPNAPSLLQTGAGCLWARLPPDLLFTCCPLDIRRQKPCQAEERTAIPLCLCLHLSLRAGYSWLHVKLRDHEQVFSVSQPPFG